MSSSLLEDADIDRDRRAFELFDVNGSLLEVHLLRPPRLQFILLPLGLNGLLIVGNIKIAAILIAFHFFFDQSFPRL